jgi:hypothetical protein
MDPNNKKSKILFHKIFLVIIIYFQKLNWLQHSMA